MPDRFHNQCFMDTAWGWLLAGVPSGQLRPMQHTVEMINMLQNKTYGLLICHKSLYHTIQKIIRAAVVLELPRQAEEEMQANSPRYYTSLGLALQPETFIISLICQYCAL